MRKLCYDYNMKNGEIRQANLQKETLENLKALVTKQRLQLKGYFYHLSKYQRNTNLSINSSINSYPFPVSAETPLQPNIVD